MNDMTVGKPSKLIVAFSLPLLIGNVFQQLYYIFDAVILGKFVSEKALGAVGASFPVLYLVLAIIIGVAMGASVIISQYFGAGDTDKLRKTISTTIILTLVASVIFGLIGIAVSKPLLRFLGTPEDIIGDAYAFLVILFAFLIFIFFFNALSAGLRGLGDSKTPLWFLLISTIINVGLSLLFVGLFKWGVPGAAVATVVSQALCCGFAVWYIYAKVPLFKFKMSEFVFDKEICKTILKYGIPSAVQQSVVALSIVIVQSLVNSFGTNFIAAYTAASRVDAIAMMPIMNISMALSTYVAQNIGANKLNRIKSGVNTTLIISILTGLGIYLLILLFGSQIMNLFITDENREASVEIISMGSSYLAVVAVFYFVMGILMSYEGALRGAGDINMATTISFTSLFTRIFVAYALKPYIGMACIWWSVPIGWTIAAIVSTAAYYSGRWKKKSIAGDNLTYEAS